MVRIRTIKLFLLNLRKEDKVRDQRAKYYRENKERINRERREKRQKAKELNVAKQSVVDDDTSVVDNSATKKYDWALYKRRQRARAKEVIERKKDKPITNKCKRSSVVSRHTTFPTRRAKKWHVDLVRSHLPKSPTKKAAVVAALIESPTTRKSLEKKGLINTAEKSEEAEIAVSAMRDARDAISVTKGQRCNDSCTATQTALGFLCGDTIKSNRMKTKVSQMLNINRKRVGKAYNHGSKVVKSKKSCSRSDAIPTEHRKLAHDFWACPDISRTTPNKKDIVRKRLAPKTYVTHPRQILEKMQTEAFLEDIKMGQRSFESCKPFYVSTPRSQDRVSCCCRIHVETRMVFQSCMEFRRQLPHRPEQYIVYKHLTDLVNDTLCPKPEEEKYHHPDCLQRVCKNCGTASFKVLDEEKESNEAAPLVKWRKFEYVVIGVDDDNSDKKKLKLVDKLTFPGEMFSCLQNLLQTYPSHHFRANWQNQQLRELVENLPTGHAVAIHDYSENYSCAMQDQIQSLYFSQIQASIHVTILHRHALTNVDGIESMAEDPSIVTEHIFVISPDCKHYHHSVHSARKLMDGYLNEIGMN